MILFLDIDGVLHPDPAMAEEAFCRRHLLWQLLSARTNLKVVISSDWRKRHSLAELIHFIISDGNMALKQRFVGVTPVLPGALYEYRSRERECLAWLTQHGAGEQSWVALDDVAGNFTFGSPQLVLTNSQTGLTAKNIDTALSKVPVENRSA